RHRDTPLLEGVRLAPGPAGDEPVLPADDCAPVDADALRAANPELGGFLRAPGQLHGAHQHLFGDSPRSETGPGEPILLDERGPRVELDSAVRGEGTRRAGADDEKAVIHARPLLPPIIPGVARSEFPSEGRWSDRGTKGPQPPCKVFQAARWTARQGVPPQAEPETTE